MEVKVDAQRWANIESLVALWKSGNMTADDAMKKIQSEVFPLNKERQG